MMGQQMPNGGPRGLPAGLQPVEEPEGNAEDMDEDSDSDDGASNKKYQDYKCKPRRKATQKPVGADQKRQAFSKRKRGIVLKAYQLYKLTDAKVFMFVVNDKGSSWSYASPGFGAALQPGHLRHMRELAGLPPTPKHVTEIMAHPKLDDQDRQLDDRHVFLHGASVHDQVHLTNGAIPDRHAYEGPAAGTRYKQSGPAPPPAIAAPAPPPALPMYKPGPPVIRPGQPPQMTVPPPVAPPAIPLQSTQPPPQPPANAGPPPIMQQQDASRARVPPKYQFNLQLGEHELEVPGEMGMTGETIITPSGNKLAAAVGISLATLAPQPGRPEAPEMSTTHHTSGSGTSEQAAQSIPHSGALGGHGVHAGVGSNSFSGQVGQMITDAAGNIYRIVQEPVMAQPPAMAAMMPPPPTKYSPPDAATAVGDALATLAEAAAAQQRSPNLTAPLNMSGSTDSNYAAQYWMDPQRMQQYMPALERAGPAQMKQFLEQYQEPAQPRIQQYPPPGFGVDQYGQLVMLPQGDWQHA